MRPRILSLPLLLVSLYGLPGAAPGQAAGEDFSAAAKQAAGEMDERFPLRSIRIEGNDHYGTDEIIAVMGLKAGDKVNRSDFEQALERLSDTGAFESLRFRYEPQDGGYRLIFQVQEVADLYPLRLIGFGVPEEELLAWLREEVPLAGELVPPSGLMVRRIGKALDGFWRERGGESEVAGRLEPSGPDELEMVFQPVEQIETIAFTKFENTGELSAYELQRTFNHVAMGVPYTERRLKELLRFNIKPLYEELGYLEVEFCPCRTEPDPDTKGLAVTIEVQPGEVYKFGNIELPVTELLPPQEMAGLMKVASGQVADMAKLRDSLGAIEQELRNRGYMKAEAEEERTLNRKTKTVDIRVRVVPGERYTFNRLLITGINVIAEAAVKKRWALNYGDPFNAGYPAVFLNHIEREGMFDNLDSTDYRVSVNEAQRTVDVELIFE